MELKGDPELVEAFRRGDREVLADLYRAHVEEVRRLLRHGFTFTSRGRSIRFRGFEEPFRLQEVLQESMIHAFRQTARDAYDGSQPYRPYLISIVRNYVIDRYRRERTYSARFVAVGDIAAERESEQEAMDRLGAAPEPSPEARALQAQLSDALQSFVAALEEQDRTVLTQHLMGELTQTEVAEAIGTDRNDVRKRIRTMRDRLLKHLKRQGFIGSLDPAEIFRK